ncbi:MAG: hypothetical protein ACT4PJ_07945 [Gemmatimonadaceae bacterium]
MGHLLDRAPALAADMVDAASAALSAAWPLSLAVREMERLAGDGYVIGEVCDVDFSLALDSPEQIEMALSAAMLAGFTIIDPDQASRGFVTVRRPVRLKAYDLLRATSRLNRAVWRYGACAEIVGPATPATRADAPTGQAA